MKSGNAISLRDLLLAGVHLGHQTRRWNPKIAPYIFGQERKMHLFDLVKTDENLKRAAAFLEKTVSAGGKIVFVGTKRQIRTRVREEAKRCGALFIVERWIGGLLTNFEAVAKNFEHYRQLEEEKKNGAWEVFTKKEKVKLERKRAKLETLIGGVASLSSLPQALFVIDVRKEKIAVAEAHQMGVPVVGVVDSNSDPTRIDYVIPANDDSNRSVGLLIHVMANAVLAGSQAGNAKEAKASVVDKPRQKRKIVRAGQRAKTIAPKSKKKTPPSKTRDS